MKRSAKEMNRRNLVSATRQSASRVRYILSLAKSIDEDARREERLGDQQCKACFYQDKIGGAAMTSQPCMCCGTDQLFTSTNTDALCLRCAREHALCKHCGGDIEMNTEREAWPV